MSAPNARHPEGLQRLNSIQPLPLIQRDALARALIEGGMHAPNESARDSAAGLQWREGVEVKDLFETASVNISGALGMLNLLQVAGDNDPITLRAVEGMLSMLSLAGGAVAVLAQMGFELEAQPVRPPREPAT